MPMATKQGRRRQRKKAPGDGERRGASESRRVTGRSLIVFWLVLVVLVSLTVFSIYSGVQQHGHIHAPLIWLVLLAGMILLAAVLSLNWLRSRSKRITAAPPSRRKRKHL